MFDTPSPTDVPAARRYRGSTVAAALLALVALFMLSVAAPAVGHTPRPPAGSGHGKRIVYKESTQRVWLVRADRSVAATYLVSGHRYRTLPRPGTYRVQSKSRHTTSLDGTLTMEYMVRFVYGRTAWIGFHSIPRTRAGRLVQPTSKLGTPTSSGCIRQRVTDAKRLWDFARVGTKVVVVR